MITANGNQPAHAALDKIWDAASLETANTSKHALVFSINAQDFAIAAEFIEQILELPGITEVPGAGATLLGLAEHGARPVPVVDITPLLHVSTVGDVRAAGVDSFRHGLLLNHNGIRVMLAIETVIVLKKVIKESDATTQSSEFADYIGVVKEEHAVAAGDTDTNIKNDRRVAVLNVPRLLQAVQRAAVSGSVS